jgi:hypothetical protein
LRHHAHFSLEPEEKLAAGDGFHGSQSAGSGEGGHFLLLPEESSNFVELAEGPFGVFEAKFVKVELEEADVLRSSALLGYHLGLHGPGGGGLIEFSDVDILEVHVCAAFSFGHFGLGALLVGLTFAHAEGVLAGGAKGLDVEDDHGVLLRVHELVLLIGVHMVPFFDDSGDNLRFAEVSKLVLELFVSES